MGRLPGWWGWWWWRAVGTTLMLVLLLPDCLTEHPPQEEGAQEELEWAAAVVEVNLTVDHAHSDAHGHAQTRLEEEESVMQVIMDRRLYKFTLTPSSWLVSEDATLSRVGYLSGREEQHVPLSSRPCLYLARPGPGIVNGPSGTVSLCHSDGPRVLLMTERELAELVPRAKLPPLSPDTQKRGEGSYTHVVKRHPLPGIMDQDCPSHDSCGRSSFPLPDDIPDISEVMVDPAAIEDMKRTGGGGKGTTVGGGAGGAGGGGGGAGAGGKDSPLTVELGMFLDQALIDTFTAFLTPEQELVDLVLGLVNNVQALYSHPSLGRQVDFTITHLRLLAKQPADLPTHKGNRIGLLKSFCAYNKKNNDPDDSSPNHWDIGIYLSGLNFYEKKADGSEKSVTMGLAYTGGVCRADQSCVINELGAVNYRGHPYPSAGALSSYVLAHELGHSLGLRHDGVSNRCNSSGYIMAAGRGLRGATTWSTCAKDMILQLQKACLKEGGAGGAAAVGQWDHTKFLGLPGQRWDATAQCRLFLRDEDAGLPQKTKISEVCTSVTCMSPHRISTYLAGPALEGTHCGGEKWCRGGKCEPWGAEGPRETVAGGWGPWQHGECVSGCVEGGTGYKVSRRVCDSPPAVNSVAGCLGIETRRELCPDDKVCGLTPRKTVNKLASEMCQVVSKYKPAIEGVGRQLSYTAATPWQACALYCKKKNSTSYWTPRYEFKDMPHIATHLPDGTPCHTANYVCQNRNCVPKVTKARSVSFAPEDKLLESELSADYQPIDLDDLFS